MIPLLSGATYGFGREGERICTGSQMGRRNEIPNDPKNFEIKLSLVKLHLQDGCYDYQGAYWGAPDNLYYASAEYEDLTRQDETGVCRVFVRASSREEAKSNVRKILPKAKFFR